MPRDGSGVYSTPPGTHGTPNTTILSANYNSNVDDVAADLNTPRPIVAGGTGATTAADALTALGAVAKTGDTMTGTLTVSMANANLILTKPASGTACIVAGKNGANNRWQIQFGDVGAETGGNTGSDFQVYRFADAGGSLDAPIKAIRSTGQVLIGVPATSPPLPTGLHVSFSGGTINHGLSIRGVVDGGYTEVFSNAAGTVVGTITCTTTNTAFNTASDGRLKEDLKSFDAGNVVDKTNVYDFAWKATGVRDYGVIAQEAVDVYPAAVHHNEDLDHWFIDYSKYVPVLLQELKALRARVAMLEGDFSGKPA